MVQASYYFWAYLQLRPRVDGPVDFVVPTGAFGNATGGLVAKLMGLPVGRIVCATNANDVVHRTIAFGDLAMAPSVATVSPAMDIQFAYNVERMLYLVSGGDTSSTARYMNAAQERRVLPLPPWLLAKVQEVFLSSAVSDAQTCETMLQVHRESGRTIDPHSAVGVHAARSARVRAALRAGRAPGTPPPPVCCVLTAHPAKFEAACRRAGVPVATSAEVEALKVAPRAFEWLRAPTAGEDKLDLWAREIKRRVEEAAEARGGSVPRARL